VDRTYYFLQEDFWTKPALVILFGGSVFLIVFIRYLIAAGIFHLLFLHKRKAATPRRSSDKTKQLRRELFWSATSSLIFAVLAVASYYVYQAGWTQIYFDLPRAGTAYFVISVVTYLVLYETYYYWLHRWMHRPGVFKIIHRVHHQSLSTSVFTSFSFHPLEALLQFLFLPVLLVLVPIHLYALIVVLSIMTLSAVINHAELEVFPRWFLKSKYGRWLINATHHNLHHHEFGTNYGLIFTWWDRWMGTESKQYEDLINDKNKHS